MDRPRRSSILKRAPTIPNSPTFTRRISFHEKKSVKEFSEGTDKVTIWHNSYEEEAVGLQASVDKENISAMQPQDQPTATASQVGILKSAPKTAKAAPIVKAELLDDEMDLTPLGDKLIEANDLHDECDFTLLPPPRSPYGQSQQNSTSAMELTLASTAMPTNSRRTSLLRRLTTRNILNMDITQNSPIHASPAQPAAAASRDLERPSSAMDMTFFAEGDTAQVAAELELELQQLQVSIMATSVLMFDEADHIAFQRSLDCISFDNTSPNITGNNNMDLASESRSYDEMEVEHILKSQKTQPALAKVSTTIYESGLDFTTIGNASSRRSLASRKTYEDHLEISCLQSPTTPAVSLPNHTIQMDQSIVADSLVVPAHQIRQSEHQAVVKEENEEHMNFTRLPDGCNEENASLDINETFHLQPGLCSTKIDMSVEEYLTLSPRSSTTATSRKSVIQTVHQIDADQRLFDRTIYLTQAAPAIEEISDSVLVSENMEASSSMRLFRTNSCDNPLNTTEELCNLNAEDLCKAEIKLETYKPTTTTTTNTCQTKPMPDTKPTQTVRQSKRLQRESLRMSDLQQHVNVTLSQPNDGSDNDSLVSEFKVDATDVGAGPQSRRCSIGTPDEKEADLCRLCEGCKNRRSATPLGQLPPLLERNAFVQSDGLEPLDYSDSNRLQMYATVDDVLVAFFAKIDEGIAQKASRTGLSSNVPSPGPVFLLNNRDANRSAGHLKAVAEDQVTPAPCPIIPPLQFLIENAFECGKSGVWDYDSLDFYLGRLRFINKRIPSVFLYGIFDFPAWQVKNNLCPIEFTKFVVVESPYAAERKMSPYNRLRHYQLLTNLPKDVLGLCKNSNQLMRFLYRLDASHYQRVCDECANIERIVDSTRGLLLQTASGQCFVQKRIFDYERLECQTVIIKLESIEHTTVHHIFTDPLLEFKTNAAAELGSGIGCIERFLGDPFRYLVRDK